MLRNSSWDNDKRKVDAQPTKIKYFIICIFVEYFEFLLLDAQIAQKITWICDFLQKYFYVGDTEGTTVTETTTFTGRYNTVCNTQAPLQIKLYFVPYLFFTDSNTKFI